MADPLTDVVEDKAEFAARFRNTGNLDQRRRFAQDLSEAKRRNDERLEAEFESMQRNDPQLMNAVTNRIQENRMGRQSAIGADLAERKFERLLDRDVTVDDLNERKFQLQENTAQRAAKKFMLDAEKAEAQQEAELIVQAREQEIRLDPKTPPGSTAYKRAVLDLLIKNPEIDKDTRNTWLQQAGYEDPDLAVEEAANRMAENPNIVRSLVRTKSGTTTLEAPGQAKTAQVKPDLERLDRLKEKRSKILAVSEKNRTDADRDLLGYYDNEISAIDAVRGAVKTPPASSVAQPAQTPPTVDPERKAAAQAFLGITK